MTDRSHLKARLSAWATRAYEKGLMVQAADWLSALAYIEELEARNQVLEAGHSKGGLASAAQKTPEERKAWGRRAADRRWGCDRARTHDPKLFTG